MIRLIEGLPEPVIGLQATGRVSRQDYDEVLIPAVRRMEEGHARIRLLYVLGDDFDGYSMGAVWEDTRLGAGSLRAWERIAVVTGATWIVDGVRLLGWMIPGEVRTFAPGEATAAREWVTEGLQGA